MPIGMLPLAKLKGRSFEMPDGKVIADATFWGPALQYCRVTCNIHKKLAQRCGSLCSVFAPGAKTLHKLPLRCAMEEWATLGLRCSSSEEHISRFAHLSAEELAFV